MTICQALDCIHNSREKEESGTCTFNEDTRAVGEWRECTSYEMDMKYAKAMGRT